MTQIENVLKQIGARLKRQNKHKVYELPSGQNFVIASTPSDSHAEANALRQLGRLGYVVPGRPRAEKNQTPFPQPAERRKVIRKPGAPRPPWSLPVNRLADTLASDPLVKAHYDDRVAALELEVATAHTRAASWAHEYAQVARELSVIKERPWYRVGRALRMVP